MPYFYSLGRIFSRFAGGCFPGPRSSLAHGHGIDLVAVSDHLCGDLPSQSRSETNTTAAHRLPWETLLAICKQADQSTVAQLCLVSFGMVELAGPVLYEHVALASPEAIRSFFIEPSPISSGSRLRPHFGAHRLCRLHIKFHLFSRENIASILPSGLWGLPDRRILSSLDIDVFTTDSLRAPPSPLIGFASKQISDLIRANHSVHTVSEFPADHTVPGTVDVQLRMVTDSPGAAATTASRTMAKRYLNMPPSAAADRVLFLNNSDASRREDWERSTTHDLRIDLRRLVESWHRGAGAVHLVALSTACLDRITLWASVDDVRVEIVVKDEIVASLLDWKIGQSVVGRERKSQCVVVRDRAIPALEWDDAAW